eukprot:GEMP01009891.1.p1 GENE.GEMP01009891.1~~GEMP01009891.1.p1  ORF type:complete len:663 (+),score=114.11 GEMP01009891.1:175-1989(+)
MKDCLCVFPEDQAIYISLHAIKNVQMMNLTVLNEPMTLKVASEIAARLCPPNSEARAVLFFACIEHSQDMEILLTLIRAFDQSQNVPPMIVVSAYTQACLKNTKVSLLEENFLRRVTDLIGSGADDVIWTGVEVESAVARQVEIALIRSMCVMERFKDKLQSTAFLHALDMAYFEELEGQCEDLLWNYIPSRVLTALPPIDYEMGLTETKRRVGDYTFVAKLGEGMMGVVYSAIDDNTGEKLALKMISKSRIDSPFELEAVYKEFRILAQWLAHPHIVQYIRAIHTPTNIYLCMELVGERNLFEYMTRQPRKRLMRPQTQTFMGQLAGAVGYCHDKHICHRDLKPENILVKNPEMVKLIDFGLAVMLKDKRWLTAQCGSMPFVAPEIMAGQKYDGCCADVWSLGVVLLEMVCGLNKMERVLAWKDTDRLDANKENANHVLAVFNDANGLLASIMPDIGSDFCGDSPEDGIKAFLHLLTGLLLITCVDKRGDMVGVAQCAWLKNHIVIVPSEPINDSPRATEATGGDSPISSSSAKIPAQEGHDTRADPLFSRESVGPAVSDRIARPKPVMSVSGHNPRKKTPHDLADSPASKSKHALDVVRTKE